MPRRDEPPVIQHPDAEEGARSLRSSSGVVKMYVCGPTTYDYSHLGHARSYIDFDVARRYLEFLGHRVIYVQNFTDIEEVIIRRAKEAGKPPLAFAQYYIDSFLEDMRALNVRTADHMPKVSEHIPEIVGLISRLVERGFAYSVEGEVYFRTKKTKHSFGILTHQRFEDIVVESPGAGSQKEHPLVSRSGRDPKAMNRPGRAHGARAVRDGTSNATRWRTNISGPRSTSTAGESI